MNKITNRYNILRGIFIASVKIPGRAECSAEEKAASKAQPVLDDNPCMKKLRKLLIGILTLMHQRVNQAQDMNEQDSGMEEKSNSQLLVLLKYFATSVTEPTLQESHSQSKQEKSSQKYSIMWFFRAGT